MARENPVQAPLLDLVTGKSELRPSSLRRRADGKEDTEVIDVSEIRGSHRGGACRR